MLTSAHLSAVCNPFSFLVTLVPAFEPGSTPYLDRIWKDLPHAPRAVAALSYLLDAAYAFEEAIERGESDLAASIRADSLRVEDEFESLYCVPAAAGLVLFRTVMDFYGEHPAPLPGGGSVDAVLLLALSRLGYVDGLCGIGLEAEVSEWEEERAAGLPRPEPETEEEEESASRVRLRLEERLLPSYEEGYLYGLAERHLNLYLPSLREQIDREAERAYEHPEEEEFPSASLAGEVHNLPAGLREAAEQYLLSRQQGIEEERARRIFQAHLPDGIPLSPRTLALWVQSLTPPPAWEEEESSEFEASLLRALVLLSALGFSEGTVDALLASARELAPRSAEEILSRHERLPCMANPVRPVLRALETGVPGTGAWPYRTGLFFPSSEEGGVMVGLLSDLLRPKTRQAWARAFFPSLFASRAPHGGEVLWREGRSFLRLEGAAKSVRRASGSSVGPAEELIAERLVAHYGPPSSDPASLLYFQHLETQLMQPLGRGRRARLHRALERTVATRLAVALLRQRDADGWRQMRAEAEVVKNGSALELQAGELWLRTYRHEADSASLSSEERLLLLARARLLESTLEERARTEAMEALCSLAPEVLEEESSAAVFEQKRLAEVALASARVRESFEHEVNVHPEFRKRLLRSVGLAALRWAHAEIALAEDFRLTADSTPLGASGNFLPPRQES